MTFTHYPWINYIRNPRRNMPLRLRQPKLPKEAGDRNQLALKRAFQHQKAYATQKLPPPHSHVY